MPTFSEIEAITRRCIFIATNLSKNQYEELGLDVNHWCDLIYKYNKDIISIETLLGCDGTVIVDVSYDGDRVLSCENDSCYEEDYKIFIYKSGNWEREVLRIYEGLQVHRQLSLPFT